MENGTAKKSRMPRGKAGKILLNLLVTTIVGAGYFYIALPALNLHSPDLYGFIILLCVVYVLCALVTSGFHLESSTTSVVTGPDGRPVTIHRGGLKEYFRFMKSQCLPILILLLALAAVYLVGSLLSSPIFRASAYRDLLLPRTGDFAAEVTQISFDEIPTLDRSSAEYLGDRQMGTLSDMVSQFEYSGDSTQINYQGRPVRVAPIGYADIIKWFTNRGNGLPAYVVVDMVTQEATVTRLTEGMKYSFSEPLNRNVMRHLRFKYPTMMFAEPEFEVNEEGRPFWIAPRIVKTIGLFGGTDIKGAVLLDAVSGECVYYDAADVPTWVDNLYDPDLVMQQYDYHGTLIHGFLNSIFGQRDVTQTTDGYNYIAMNDDVYMYTGVTSANADQSNLGFLLCNLRTKDTSFYTAPGATEEAAKLSAQGVVQDLGYVATFPILLNIAGEPTYFIPMKDAANLVKMYAMVNVSRYDIVATGSTVTAAEEEYIRLLGDRGIVIPDALPQTTVSGIVEELRSAVLNGNTYYFIRLEGESVFYSVSAADNNVAVILNVGDTVTIEHAPVEEGSAADILTGYSVKRDKKGAAPAPEASVPTLPISLQDLIDQAKAEGKELHIEYSAAQTPAP